MRSSDGEDRPIPNSYWVKPSRLLAGEYPGPEAHGDSGKRLNALLEAGINHFVDLTEPYETAPYVGPSGQLVPRLGESITWERHPIVDRGIPRNPERMAGALDAIDGALGAGKNVYIHCMGGVGRTGTAVGCWLVRHGLTGDDALRRVAHLWRVTTFARYLSSSPATLEQKAYVRRWRELSRALDNQ